VTSLASRRSVWAVRRSPTVSDGTPPTVWNGPAPPAVSDVANTPNAPRRCGDRPRCAPRLPHSVRSLLGWLRRYVPATPRPVQSHPSPRASPADSFASSLRSSANSSLARTSGRARP
jgi:hypothetical protein